MEDFSAAQVGKIPENTGRHRGTAHGLCRKTFLLQLENMLTCTPLAHQVKKHAIGADHTDKTVIRAQGEIIVTRHISHLGFLPQKDTFILQ